MPTKISYVVSGDIITNCIVMNADEDPSKYGAVDFPESSETPSIGWEVIDGVPRRVAEVLPQPTAYELKLAGVEFEGVMCSATAEDMWGLTSVRSWVMAGNPTNFKFDNGSVLTLTVDNMEAFEAVWAPFRASFF